MPATATAATTRTRRPAAPAAPATGPADALVVVMTLHSKELSKTRRYDSSAEGAAMSSAYIYKSALAAFGDLPAALRLTIEKVA